MLTIKICHIVVTDEAMTFKFGTQTGAGAYCGGHLAAQLVIYSIIGWAVAFGTARRGLGGAVARPGTPLAVYQT